MIRPVSRLRTDSTFVSTVTVLLALVALAGTVALTAAASTGATGDQADRPTVDVDAASLADGETETVVLTLSTASEGLSGYNLELAVADADVARIESASYPDRFGLTTDPEVGADGRTITLEAADLDGAVESGATNVTLAHVNVTGVGPGVANLSVEPVQFDGDDGSRIEPVPEPGVVTVDSTGGVDPERQEEAGAADENDPGAQADGNDPAVPADRNPTTPGGTVTGPVWPLATGVVFVAAAILTLGAVAYRRRSS